MRYIPALIIAIAIVLTPIVWHFAASLSDEERRGGVSSVDSSARIDIAEIQVELLELRSTIADLQSQSAVLRQQLSARAMPSAPEPAPNLQGGQTGIDTSAYPDVVLIGDRRRINVGLRHANTSFLVGLLGMPAENLGDTCAPMTNPKLRALLETREVGPVRVRMLKPALDSLETIFDKIRLSDEELYKRINTAGSLCVRFVRGSRTSLSAHAFGLAVDLNINGVLDTLGDGKTQLGLTILADFFREEGWIWGAAFGREDSMHFEVSRDLLEQWRAEGRI